MTVALVLAAALMAASGSATLGQSAQAASAATTATTPETITSGKDPNKVVCKQQQIAGSNIKTRECKTRAQWAAQEREVDRFFRDSAHRGGQNTQAGGAPF